MFFAVTVVVGLVGLLASLVYLLDFARASRCDDLYAPAHSRRTRRARRVTGMYARNNGGSALTALRTDHDLVPH